MSARKVWATRHDFAGAPMVRYESKAAAYRNIARKAADVHAYRCHRLTVFVDERDGRGWQTYERIDLAELRGGA